MDRKKKLIEPNRSNKFHGKIEKTEKKIKTRKNEKHVSNRKDKKKEK